jgi:hypothetical protein
VDGRARLSDFWVSASKSDELGFRGEAMDIFDFSEEMAGSSFADTFDGSEDLKLVFFRRINFVKEAS